MSISSDNRKLLGFIAAVTLLVTGCAKKYYWWEDSQAPHQGMAAWHPHRQYTPDVAAALSLLADTDPAEVSYLQSRGYPITFVPGTPGRMGDTTALGVIEIPRRFEGKPAQLAVVLSHEIVHEQRHDPFVTPTEYPLWRRLLWHQEEEVAHDKDLWVAMKLSIRNPSVWNVFGAQWLLEPPLYVMVGPQCIFAIIYLLILGNRARQSFMKWLAPRLPQRQTA